MWSGLGTKQAAPVPSGISFLRGLLDGMLASMTHPQVLRGCNQIAGKQRRAAAQEGHICYAAARLNPGWTALHLISVLPILRRRFVTVAEVMCSRSAISPVLSPSTKQ